MVIWMEHLRDEAGLGGLVEVLSIFVSGVTDQSGGTLRSHGGKTEKLSQEASEYRNRKKVGRN